LTTLKELSTGPYHVHKDENPRGDGGRNSLTRRAVSWLRRENWQFCRGREELILQVNLKLPLNLTPMSITCNEKNLKNHSCPEPVVRIDLAGFKVIYRIFF